MVVDTNTDCLAKYAGRETIGKMSLTNKKEPKLKRREYERQNTKSRTIQDFAGH